MSLDNLEREIRSINLKAEWLAITSELSDLGVPVHNSVALKLTEDDLPNLTEPILDNFNSYYGNYQNYCSTVNEATRKKSLEIASRKTMEDHFLEWFSLDIAQTLIDTEFIFSNEIVPLESDDGNILNIYPVTGLSVDQLEILLATLPGILIDEAALVTMSLYPVNKLTNPDPRSVNNGIRFSLIPPKNALREGLPRVKQNDLLRSLKTKYPHLGTLGLIEASQYANTLRQMPSNHQELNFRFFELDPKKPKSFRGNLDAKDPDHTELSPMQDAQSLKVHLDNEGNIILDISSPKNPEGTLIVIA